MKKPVMVFTIIFCLGSVALSHAGNCNGLMKYVNAARDSMVDDFVQYNVKALGRDSEDLVFWDSYLQTKCSWGSIAETPVQWLSRRTQGRQLTPYVAGFLFWLEELRSQGLDISPSGLVRGRTFNQ